MSKRTLLVPDQVWTDGETHRGWCVLVEGERIAAAGLRQTIGEVTDCETIDISGCTVLPGLMDLHSHLFLHPYNETSWDDQVLKETEAYRTARAVAHAEATLMAGFTTLRDLGTEGAGYADVSLKRAIDDGIVKGPRLFVAGRAIVATGAYGPARRNYRTDCCFPQGGLEASGVEELVRAVRMEAAHGCRLDQALRRLSRGTFGRDPPDVLSGRDERGCCCRARSRPPRGGACDDG